MAQWIIKDDRRASIDFGIMAVTISLGHSVDDESQEYSVSINIKDASERNGMILASTWVEATSIDDACNQASEYVRNVVAVYVAKLLSASKNIDKIDATKTALPLTDKTKRLMGVY